MVLHNLKVEVSGQASDEGEEAEDGKEEELETIGVKAEDKIISLDVVTDSGDVLLGTGGASKEHGDGRTLLALKLGEAVLVDVLSGNTTEGLELAGLGGLGVEGGVTLDLLGGVREVGDLEVLRRGLVSSTGDVTEANLLGGITEGGVSLGLRRASGSSSRGSGLANSTGGEKRGVSRGGGHKGKKDASSLHLDGII